ncbi:hypothetical protein AB0425_15635 [Actinosynnema sp. NPDC051121]
MADATRLDIAGDAIAALSAYDPTTPLRVPAQSGYPLQHVLARVACTSDDAEGDGTPPTEPSAVWLGVGERVDTLPESDALGWSR